jgi:perosamine synthetase
MINIAKPLLGKEEKKAVCDVLDTGALALGKVVTEFENEFSGFIGCKYGIATSSGTTALEVALKSIGLRKGDKILTTPFSFIATANSIIYAGAIPVFADINEGTFNISPEAIEKALSQTPDIKALLIVHLFAQSCDMDRIMKIIRKYNLLLIEDCAQSHGAMWNNKNTGSFGDVSCFSFYPTKNMTTSEGGMILTNSEELQKKCRLIINHGMNIRYHHDIIGYNYRMTNIAAAIGLCQLKKLQMFNSRRKKNAFYYNGNIRNPIIKIPVNHEKSDHVYHQYTVLILDNQRDLFLKHLEANQIEYGIFYPKSIPEQKCYSDMNFEKEYDTTDKVKHQVVSIPVHPGLSDNDIKIVVETVNSFSRK